MVLQQPDSALIGLMTGFDLGPDGQILIADMVQTNAKLYDSTGRLIRVIGRPGDGPGEFRFPRFPRFAANGNILVGEGRGLIQVFSPAGAPIRTIHPAGLTFFLGFRPLADGSLLILGGTGAVSSLVRYDSAGAHPRELFSRQGVPVTDHPESPRWAGLSFYFFSQVADTAIVVAALSDTLWKVNIRTGETRAAIMSFPGFTRPKLPPKTAAAGFEWATAFFRAWPPVASAGVLAIPFARGFVYDNEEQAALVWSRATGWIAVRNAPTIIGAAGGDVIAVAADDSGTMRMNFLTPVLGGGHK